MKCDKCKKERAVSAVDEATQLCEDFINKTEKIIADRIKDEQKRRNINRRA